MRRLVINIATRGRPALLTESAERTLRNITSPDTVLMISADEDDPQTAEVVQALARKHGVLASVMPREDTVAGKWNRAMSLPADVHMPLADDCPPMTKGFDRLVLEAADRFPDGIGMVYGPLVNASFPALICMTAGFVEKMGYIYPEFFGFWFVDHWTDDVVRMIDRISFANVEMEQKIQPGTQEMREPAWWATFFDAGAIARRRQARAIIDSPDFIEPEWRKEILRRHYPLIEYRSKWINSNVRDLAQRMRTLAPETGGDRYTRIKAKARVLLREWVDDMKAEAGVAVEPAKAAE